MVMARDVTMGRTLLTCAKPPILVWTLVPHLVAAYDRVRVEDLPFFPQAYIHSLPSGSNVQVLSIMWMAMEAFLCANGFRDCTMPAGVVTNRFSTLLATTTTSYHSKRPTTMPSNCATCTTQSSQPTTRW